MVIVDELEINEHFAIEFNKHQSNNIKTLQFYFIRVSISPLSLCLYGTSLTSDLILLKKLLTHL